jgi:hypothetical protein
VALRSGLGDVQNRVALYFFSSAVTMGLVIFFFVQIVLICLRVLVKLYSKGEGQFPFFLLCLGPAKAS